MKRTISLLLCFVLILGMTTTAFGAADIEDYYTPRTDEAIEQAAEAETAAAAATAAAAEAAAAADAAKAAADAANTQASEAEKVYKEEPDASAAPQRRMYHRLR